MLTLESQASCRGLPALFQSICALQALVQDSVLKRRKTHGNGSTHEPTPILAVKMVDQAHLTSQGPGLSIPASRSSQGEV